MINYIKDSEKTSGCGPLLHRDRSNSVPLRQQIFQHVRASGRTARADITRALNISAGSATTQTAELIASGFLREVDEPARESGRGRPRVALEVVPEAAFVIGINLSTKNHSAVLCDFDGTVVTTTTLATTNKRRSSAQLLDEIETLFAQLIKKAEMSDQDIKAVGVGLPGIVDHARGTITWCSLLHDSNVDLCAAFSKRSNTPLFLDNDTNMLALSELWFGAGRDKTDFAVVTIEKGVGMGLVVNNRLYRGTHGMGLELGHTKVQLDGALCRCGQRGCLEAYLGDYALTREAVTALNMEFSDPIDPENLLNLLFQKAKAGHSAAEVIFRRAGRYLSVGLSNVVQLFDPPLIILFGEWMQYEHLYADQVLAEMQKLTLSNGRQPCEIEIRPWDDMVWARGATVPALSALADTMVGGLKVQNL